ncbi:hypothetical protein MCUN1_001682 [Malassezia cuniculi]|uniref:Zinc metalloprotease n=1 Tax=Malassezia cuniculi TaxID=948313 RepID=A0AAF0EYA3_9BASI|nr:hypothetical protein MCUN1_001682 [Malassezia cuniculi]
MADTPTKYKNFQLHAQVPVPIMPGTVLEKWQSTVTGLTVLWANFESPLLNSYITVASEIFNDSGVPHTLEHLVFLGSEQYPYKGVLDTLANRAFAQGTNAWTANDHTAYTLTTAGSDGFLRMLPIYLDHVFHPTLTASGFATEVYHVNPRFEDAGVVYSEMQGRENSSADRVELKTQRMLYPPTSGYRSETGGLMSALRVLTIDDIRKYHKEYYAPHNVAVVVCGMLERETLLDSLMVTEQRLIDKGHVFGAQGPPGWRRPFLETGSAVPPVIDGSRADIEGVDNADPPTSDPLRRRVFVEFPEADESVGEVQLSWVGPPPEALLDLQAIELLGIYLCDSAVSPVQHEFVERDDPLCTDAYFATTERAGASLLSALFSGVPTSELDELDIKLHKLLLRIVEEGVQMPRMSMLLRRERQRVLSQLETRPADCFSDMLISDFLYAPRDGSRLSESVDEMRRYDQLSLYSADDWANLLRRYFVDSARLVVSARPSAALVQQLRDETVQRVAKRRVELGDAGSKRLAEELSKAQAENDVAIPPQMLEDFAIPKSSTIRWIPVGSALSGKEPVSPCGNAIVRADTELDKKVQAYIDADAHAPPYFMQFDHIQSKFVLITLVMSTASVPQSLRGLLTLYLSTLFSLPVTRDGKELTYEQVVQGLDETLLDYEATMGIGSNFAENVTIEVKVEAALYDKAVAWLRDLLWFSTFSVERIRVAAAKLAQSLPEQKRDGRAVSLALSRALLFEDHDSTCVRNSVISQAEVVPHIVERLRSEPEAVVHEFETIRNTLFRPDNFCVNVAGDILALPAPRTTWLENFVLPEWSSHKPCPVPLSWSRDVRSVLGQQPSKRAALCTLPTIESSFAVFSARGITDYLHEDYAALVVTIAILNAMESFLWRHIRGAGLAYGASIRSDPEAKHIHFMLYRSPDSGKAYEAAREVIRGLAGRNDPGLQIDQTTLDSAKSSLHFSIADAEGTMGAAALESFLDTVVKRVGKGRGRRLLEQASDVTIEDVYRCLNTYVLPIFDANTSVAAVATAPSNLAAIEERLSKAGYELEHWSMPGGDASSSSSEQGSDTSDDESITE